MKVKQYPYALTCRECGAILLLLSEKYDGVPVKETNSRWPGGRKTKEGEAIPECCGVGSFSLKDVVRLASPEVVFD